MLEPFSFKNSKDLVSVLPTKQKWALNSQRFYHNKSKQKLIKLFSRKKQRTLKRKSIKVKMLRQITQLKPQSNTWRRRMQPSIKKHLLPELGVFSLISIRILNVIMKRPPVQKMVKTTIDKEKIMILPSYLSLMVKSLEPKVIKLPLNNAKVKLSLTVI